MADQGMPDHQVTLGEVYRLVLRVDSRLDALSRDMVGRNEYESDQEATERRLSALEAKTSAETGKLHGRIDGLQKSDLDLKKVQTQGRLALAGSAIAALVAAVGLIVVAIINRGGI